MDYNAAITSVFEHLEADHLEQAVMGCLRLARHTHDHLNATIFLHEIYADKDQTQRVFFEDTAKLNEEAQKFLWQRAFDIWRAGRTLDHGKEMAPRSSSRTVVKEKSVLLLGVGELDSENYRAGTLHSGLGNSTGNGGI